jgi:hypothetical protein
VNPGNVAAVTVPGMFCFLAWLIFSTIRRYKIAKAQAQVQTKLLDKIGSGQELLAYAQSDAGKQLLESLKVERIAPHTRIIGALQAGIVSLLVGAAFLLLHSEVPDEHHGLVVFGTLGCALGLGFALSAGASYFLSKSFGLLNGGASRS